MIRGIAGGWIMVDRRGLLARLDARTPLMVLEALGGSGRRTVLRQWATATPDEVRVVLEQDVRTHPIANGPLWARALRAVTAAHGLDAGLVAALEDDPGPAEIVALVRRALVTTGRPCSVVLLSWDWVPSRQAQLDQRWILLELLLTVPGLRARVALVDAGPLSAAAAASGVATAVLDEPDLYLAPDEVEDLLREWGEPSPGAAERVRRTTGGHPGAITAVLRVAPAVVLEGRLSAEQSVRALRLDVSGVAPASDVPFYRALRLLARARRLTAGEARALLPDVDSDAVLRRLVRAGLARPRVHPVLGESVLTWVPEVRTKIVDHLDRIGVSSVEDHRRIAAAAAATGDHELAIVAHLQAGDVAVAETWTADHLWDVLETVDPVLWGPPGHSAVRAPGALPIPPAAPPAAAAARCARLPARRRPRAPPGRRGRPCRRPCPPFPPRGAGARRVRGGRGR